MAQGRWRDGHVGGGLRGRHGRVAGATAHGPRCAVRGLEALKKPSKQLGPAYTGCSDAVSVVLDERAPLQGDGLPSMHCRPGPLREAADLPKLGDGWKPQEVEVSRFAV